ncbi:MAG: prolyl oligopeptidase family serine peptidase [Bacteroidota bacterium]
MRQRLLLIIICLPGMIYSQKRETSQDAYQINNDSKPAIDSSIIANWQSIYSNAGYKGIISNNGEYVSYSIQIGNFRQGNTRKLVLQSTKSLIKKEFNDASPVCFSSDGKQFVFKRKDSLCFCNLSNGTTQYVNSVESVSIPEQNNGRWFVYQKKSGAKRKYVLRNLLTDIEKEIGNATETKFDKLGTTLIVKNTAINGNDTINNLQWWDLETGSVKTIWSSAHGEKVSYNSNVFVNGKVKKIVLLVSSTHDNRSNNSIWYYSNGMEMAELKCSNLTIQNQIGQDWRIRNVESDFNSTGDYFFFTIERKITRKLPDPKLEQVDIWRYRDPKLPIDYGEASHLKPYLITSFDLNSNKVTRIEEENEDFKIKDRNTPCTQFGLLIKRKRTGNYSEGSLLAFEKDIRECYSVSIIDGRRRLLSKTDSSGNFNNIKYSPLGNWILVYNKDKGLMSYDTRHDKIKTIFPKINQGPGVPLFQIVEWLANERKIIISDGYDLWSLDPAGIGTPVNITNYYGRKNHITFKLLNNEGVIIQDSSLLLAAFGLNNKQQGIFRINSLIGGKFEKLFMGAVLMSDRVDYDGNPVARGPVNLFLTKAKNSETWLTAMQASDKAPNYLFSHDLKTFQPLTQFEPQKRCNWLRSELVTYKQLDGRLTQGILYKPDNFNPNKKYPVIFTCYQDATNLLNAFIDPGENHAVINVPWCVSRGYLVFCPDIETVRQHPGRSAYNSVVAAAQFLSRLAYVDATRMGINGHSFGSTEINFIIAHTQLFAAAFTACGTADMFSTYGYNGKFPNAGWVEAGQCQMYASPPLAISSYLDESPALFANKVTTPLLMMFNKNDYANYVQGVEFFINLRRLDKKAWLLQYDNGDHDVYDDKPIADLNIREMQFFDHYLKGAPAPVWMTRGIPAELKQIESGFELDPNGSCGDDCDVCKKLNKNL